MVTEVNHESEIKRLLIKLAGPQYIKKWFDDRCAAFGNLTPKEMLQQGKGQEIIDKLNVLYKRSDRSKIADLESP
jgi:hypothetical protein